jgi:hypothetical protein
MSAAIDKVPENDKAIHKNTAKVLIIRFLIMILLS